MQTIQSILKTRPKFPQAVVGFIVKENRVLLGFRKKVSNNLGLNLTAGIGGKLESGETNEEALVREFQEEIEVIPQKYQDLGRVRFLFGNSPTWNQDVRVFVIYEWNGEPQETEVIKPLWFQKNKLPFEQMWEDNALWVPNILDGEKIDAVYLYNDKNQVIENLTAD